ncbi:GTP 3',8-cyclase MoaA [Gammaproteobacteria bacterium AH-315-M22]|nr:GTP 3',8-cyclase MoaA [Gammaproteobacteria bacterium AH-315-M22]
MQHLEQKTTTTADALSPSTLLDRYGRRFNYARIALNERCNLRCTYCMPEQGVDFQPPEKLLHKDEISRLVQVLASVGVNKLRFTGGEPTLRKDLPELVAMAANTRGIENVCLTTNGLLLHRMLDDLKHAGLTGINISLDTLSEDRFKRITRRSGLKQTLQNIELALQKGFSSIKINVVVMRGINDDEIEPFCELTRDSRLTVRFIEFMPFDAKQLWSDGDYLVRAKDIVTQLHKTYNELLVVKGSETEHHHYRIAGYKGTVAVIPAFTRSLCRNCNRIRITADGQLRNCLYSGTDYDLRGLMRRGDSNAQIVTQIEQAIAEKVVDGIEARERSVTKVAVSRISMTQIGG